VSVTVSAEPVTAAPASGASRGRRLLVPALMLAAVLVGALLPLARNHIFYFWDDSAGAAVPVWHRVAQSVLHGHFPLLNLDMWRGGDFAAEAATGMWNPVLVALMVAAHPIDNLAVGITLAKICLMLLASGGTYLLARDYGVRRTPAAVAGTVVPLAGYSFFMDGTAWVNALALTAFTPWVWWTARLVARDGRSPLWLVLTGYLAVSIGNPYGFLAVGLAILAVVVEQRRRVVVLLLSGVAVALTNVMVYLPLLLTSSVGFRAASQTLNDGFLKPSLTNLLELSTPSGEPFMNNFATTSGVGYFAVPVMYLAWFVLPTLPWLRWGLLRERWRDVTGLYVFGGAFGLLMLGPSQIWMFRWPLRLIDFFWFPVVLLWALLAGEGVQRSRWRVRAAVSAGLVTVGAYLAWGERTQTWPRHVIGGIVVLALVAILIRCGLSGRAGFAVLTAGSLLVLGLQLVWFPGNAAVTDYRFPTSAALLHQRFAKYQGTVVQLSDIGLDVAQRGPDRAYLDVLYGSMYSVAGVDSTTAYSGIGYTPMDSALCESYQGSVGCPAVWRTLWQPPPGYSVPLVDLLRADTVVVQNSLLDTRNLPAPAGWHRTPADERSGLATVWTRDDPVTSSGLVSAADGVDVRADSMVGDVGERVTYHGGGSLTFARLAWPGYRATVDGRAVPVRSGPDGLLVVDVPPGDGQMELSWSPPGRRVSALAFGLGVLLAAGLAVVSRRRTRG
jgi:hypothetical protein